MQIQDLFGDKLSRTVIPAVLEELADNIRIVNPVEQIILFDNGDERHLLVPCHKAWGNSVPCEDCISLQAIASGQKRTKIVFYGKRIFLVTALPLEYDGVLSAVEIIRDITELKNTRELEGNEEPTAMLKIAEMMALAKINSYILEDLPVHTLLQEIANDLQELFRLDEVAIRLDEEERWLTSANVSQVWSAGDSECWLEDVRRRRFFHIRKGDSPQIDNDLRRRGWAALVGMYLATKRRAYGYIMVACYWEPELLPKSSLRSLQMVADQIAIAIEHSELMADRLAKKKMEKELQLAFSVQRTLLPQSAPEIRGCDTYCSYQPAATISGDYYDFIFFADKTAVVIGDIKGKGMAAALLMAHLRSLVRAKAKHNRIPRRVISMINDFISGEDNEEMIVSLLYGLWFHQERRFVYCNAGHPYPLLYRARTGVCECLRQGGVLVGAFPAAQYEEASVILATGDILVFYTDGISEAACQDSVYGEERIRRVVVAHANLTAREIHQAIMHNLENFICPAQVVDDRTLIVLKMTDELLTEAQIPKQLS